MMKDLMQDSTIVSIDDLKQINQNKTCRIFRLRICLNNYSEPVNLTMASILIADDSDAIRLVLKDILDLGKHYSGCRRSY